MGAKKHYTRVSTDDQSVDAQVRHRTGFKKLPRKVGSGGRTGHSQPAACSARAAGNMLMVTRLDRLAPPTRDLPNPLA
jgi:DNA invertase Pin-like site-specific DNA recombinase